MKVLVALLLAGLLGVLAIGCGGGKETSSVSQMPATTARVSTSAQPPSSSSPARTTPAPSTSGSRAQSQSQSRETGTPAETRRRYPHGDNSIQTYGRRAGEADRLAVAEVVKRYYAAVAAGDGTTACSMLSSGIAKSIVQGFGRAPSLRSKGCGGILSLLFQRRSGRPAVETAIDVTQVRLNGSHGFALLHSKSIPHGEITVYREGGAWKIGALIGSALP